MKNLQAGKLFAIAFLVATLCSPGCGSKNQKPAEIFNAQALRIVDAADTVEVFRLKPDTRTPWDPATFVKEQDKVVSGSVKPPIEWVQRLKAILHNKKSYVNARKACAPRPGIAVLFKNGEEMAVLFLCFECDIFTLNAEFKDFDPARPALLKLAKEAFPQDQDIQSLE